MSELNEHEIREIREKLYGARYARWSKVGNVFTPAVVTIKRLPAGYYKILGISNELRFVKMDIDTMGILHLNSRNMDEVINDIESFWEKEKLFDEYELPYKRGIILSGPPGTGKTCLIKLLVEDLINRDGVCIEYNNNPEHLQSALGILEEIQFGTPVVVVIEDIDRVHVDSDLLNVFDGLVPLRKVVFLATTNHPGNLDDALINRPGRFDAHYKIHAPSETVRRQYIESVLRRRELGAIDIDKYVKDSESLPIGHLKELVVSSVILGKDYEQTLAMLKSIQEGQEDKDSKYYSLPLRFRKTQVIGANQ